jgi:hypothetical protein
MKRNQCIICFDRISKITDRISTSHDTLSQKHIKHDGWYHIECLKEYINYGNKNKIPTCPLCRDHLIIEIPGYDYKKTLERRNRKFLFNEFASIVIDETQIEVPVTFSVMMNTPNILLVIQNGIRHSTSFYIGMYIYILYTTIVSGFIRFGETIDIRRQTIKRWIILNRTILLFMWFEIIYSVLHYITMRTIHQCDIWFEMEETIEY